VALIVQIAAGGLAAGLDEHGRFRPVGGMRPAAEGVTYGRVSRAVWEADAELEVIPGLREFGISPGVACDQAIPGRLIQRATLYGHVQTQDAALGKGDDLLQCDDYVIRPGDELLDRHRTTEDVLWRAAPGIRAHTLTIAVTRQAKPRRISNGV
jgi:hypothetical protein